MKRSYIQYFTALVLFGSNGIVASRIALSSVHIVFLRTMLGSALLVLLFFLTGHKPSAWKYPRDLIHIVISGAAMGASWVFLFAAYGKIGVSISSLLYYCGPVFVMVLSPLLFQERLTFPKLLGFAAVLGGMICINGQAAGKLNLSGILYGGASAVLYAVMVIENKRVKHIAGIENAGIQLVFSFLTVALFACFKTGLVFSIPANSWIWIAVLGFLNTGIGCWLYLSSISSLPVQTVAVCGYLEPALAVLFSTLFLHERMTRWQILGAVLIIGGAAFGECMKYCCFSKQKSR